MCLVPIHVMCGCSRNLYVYRYVKRKRVAEMGVEEFMAMDPSSSESDLEEEEEDRLSIEEMVKPSCGDHKWKRLVPTT